MEKEFFTEKKFVYSLLSCSIVLFIFCLCFSVSAELGRDWSQATSSASWTGRYLHTSVVHNGKIWVIGGYDSSSSYKKDVWYSEDGVTWTQAIASAPWTVRAGHTSVVFKGKIWVMGGGYYSGSTHFLNDVWYSEDGVAWTQATAAAGWSPRYYHTSVVFNDKIWVMGGSDSSYNYKRDVWYSENGVTWTQATASAGWAARFYHTSVVHHNKIWVMGGRYGATNTRDVWYSEDGVTWIQATSSASWSARYSLTSVSYNGMIWIIEGCDVGGDKNDVWYSSNGINWIRMTSAAPWSIREKHTSVVFNNKIWMIGGLSNVFPGKRDVWYSVGPIKVDDWSNSTPSAGWHTRTGHSSVVFDDRMWVIGGYYNDGVDNYLGDVWSSSDGEIWTEEVSLAIWGGRARHSSVVFDNKIWVIGGYYNDGLHHYLNDIWSSDNGISWTGEVVTAPWTARSDHTSVVFNNKIWVIGGYYYDSTHHYLNDVWSSINGKDWTEETNSAPWAGRLGHASVVFNGKIWVIGGYWNDGTDHNFRDVWSSEDGVTWIEETSMAPWTARRNHTLVILDNKMWLIGGTIDGTHALYDVWFSSDGINWLLATDSAEWAGRTSHTSIFYNGKMWVLGGLNSSGYKNDVWYSSGPLAATYWKLY